LFFESDIINTSPPMRLAMDSKILVIAAVAAVIAVGGVAGFLLLGSGSGDDSDYTLLDSTDSIKKGMTAEVKGEAGDVSYYTKTVVKGVADGEVTYEETIMERNMPFGIPVSLDKFSPAKFAFDYTDPDSIPEGVEVAVDGDAYTITGGAAEYDADYTYDLVIVYDGESVLSVDGTVNSKYEDERAKRSTTDRCSTADGKLTIFVDQDAVVTKVCDIEMFYGLATEDFDLDYYGEAIAETKAGKFGGVDVTIYTLVGMIYDYDYKGVDVYVYNGYIINKTGIVGYDGVTYSLTENTTIRA